jgi:omega-amidase
MQDLTLALIQSNLVWEDKTSNLGRFAEKLKLLPGKADVIILPEMFATGFTMNASLAEGMDGQTVHWLTEQSAVTNAAVAGSFIYCQDGALFNRFVWMLPDGSYEYYDKRHLFRFGGENQHFAPGSQRKIVRYKGWNICLQVCYDLRFPVWARNDYSDGSYAYDMLVYTANWPAARRHHWRSLLIARAIENIAYVAGINRVGADGKGTLHIGDTMAVSHAGELLSCAEENAEETVLTVLSADALQTYRSRFGVGPDWDKFFLRP